MHQAGRGIKTWGSPRSSLDRRAIVAGRAAAAL